MKGTETETEEDKDFVECCEIVFRSLQSIERISNTYGINRRIPIERERSHFTSSKED
jgi:hypothetical protein